MIAGLLAVFILLGAQQPSGTPSAAPPSGVIAGVLTSADLGRPIRKAQVRIRSLSPPSTRTTTTDANGRFSFAGLAGAEYRLSASKPGYAESVFGARQPGLSRPGTVIRLATAQRIDDIVVKLARGGVISGVVTDEFGDAAFNVPVRAIRLSYFNGARTAGIAGSATTDDLGAYRIAGLMPGDYLVSAVPRDTVASQVTTAESLKTFQSQILSEARADGSEAAVRAMMTAVPEASTMAGYVPAYFGATPMPSAAAIVRVAVSEHVGGVDVPLQVVKTAMVSGTVLSVEGKPIAANVRLIDPAMSAPGVGVTFRTTQADGKFLFAGLVAGTYVVRAHAAGPEPGAVGEMALTAAANVTVGEGGTTDLTLGLRRGLSVSGRIDPQTVGDPVDLRKVFVNLLPITTSADGEMPITRAVPDAEGKFVIAGVPPARYRVTLSGLADGWMLASAMFGPKDGADVDLEPEPGTDLEGGELKLTSTSSQIAGVVLDAGGAPAAGHTVILFPSDRNHWLPQSRRIRLAQSDADGRYAITGLRPGAYRVAIVDDFEPGQEYDPASLAQFVARSTVVTIADGEQHAQDLHVR